MTGNDRRVAIITGGSQGIGAGLVAGYVERGWAVVANARTIGPKPRPEAIRPNVLARLLASCRS
jgi:NAD(P)-dependent dehydrogenase (short-subunit alcohol dehydrogenase family)